MNLFARIVSHGFALAVVALLALGLVYRGELFPEWELPGFLALGDRTGAEPAEQATQVAPPPVEVTGAGQPAAEQTSTQATAGQATTEPVTPPEAGAGTGEPAVQDAGTATGMALTDTETQESLASDTAPMTTTATAESAEAEAAPREEEARPAEPAPVAAAQQAPVTSGQMSTGDIDVGTAAADRAGEAQPAAGTTDETMSSAETVSEPASGEPEATADTTPAAPAAVTPYRVLAAAREAYWLRDYAVAEQKYQELIALDPDNPDGYGELGNMYFSQGDWEKANAAYYEAGTRLAAQGMYDRARQLVEVIRGLNGEQADELEQQIDDAESASP
jgi:tetratricopeptide (TPR) repeat protein